MNTAATNLLRSLEMMGIVSVRFRVVGLGQHVRHTVPLALSDEQKGPPSRLTSLSVAELFNAYALRPRKGEYVLNVDGGQLAFIPPVSPVDAAASAVKKHRFKAKVSLRGRRRGAYSGGHHKLAA
jgi:hypothetical protein